MDVREIRTRPGLVFDASVGGAADAPLLLMLRSVDRYDRRLLTATRTAGSARGETTAAGPSRSTAR